jgi:alkylation response protein AidB-like acyl-CoA dehydrogenase
MAVDAGVQRTLPLVTTDEEQEIRRAVAAICEPFGHRHRRAIADRPAADRALRQALADHGYLAVNLDTAWGGGGLGITGLVPVIEEIHAAGIFSGTIALSACVAGRLIERHGTPDQQGQWLRRLTGGELTIAFAITEPDAGLNTHRLRTELRRDGDGFRLSGQKVFTTGAASADAILVVARFRDEDGTLGLPGLALIDGDADGVSMDRIELAPEWEERTYQTFYDDVWVAPDRLIGGEHAGLAAVFDGLNPERICTAAAALGYARLALEQACDYARERVVWKEPIGAHQAIAHPLAEAQIACDLAELMTRRAAALCDADAPEAGSASNVAKYAAARAANLALDRAIQTHGGNGVTGEYGLTELWWPVRAMRIAPVSEEMVLNNVAQHTLGLPRGY